MRHGRPFLAAALAALNVLAFPVTADAQVPVAEPQALLPDLVQEPPARLEVKTARTPKGPRFRLGFRSAVHNAGTGPLLLDSSRPSTAEPTMTSSQVVRHADGRTVVRPGVGIMRFHSAPGHQHWHLQRFEVYELRSPAGTLVRPSQKTGFCLGDRYDVDHFTDWPNEPAAALFRQQCGLNRTDLLRLRNGISVGFGDDYDPQLEGQFIDVTGLPAADYQLVHRVNVDGALLESDYANNSACTGVRLGWPRGARRSPSFRVVPCPSHTNNTEVSS